MRQNVVRVVNVISNRDDQTSVVLRRATLLHGEGAPSHNFLAVRASGPALGALNINAWAAGQTTMLHYKLTAYEVEIPTRES